MNRTKNLRICQECRDVYTGDVSDMSLYYHEDDLEAMIEEIQQHLNQLPGLSLTGEIDEFSTRHCDCCSFRLGGVRYHAVQLVP